MRQRAWEDDPSLRAFELGAAFAQVWCALPKVVFSRTLKRVSGHARLAEASVAEVAAALPRPAQRGGTLRSAERGVARRCSSSV